MSRKNLQLIYPDGSKTHIDRSDRDDLLLAGLAKQTSLGKYLFIGEESTFDSFAAWGKSYVPQPRNLRRFYPGSFVFEFEGRRQSELMETPEACACRLKLYGDSSERTST